MDLNIKKIREDRNITQAKLAEGAGLSRTTLSALENGGEVRHYRIKLYKA